MKIVETTFERLPRERLEIGFEGENQRATVRIDCASVFAEYPNATPALIVKPLFADAYPVVVDRNGTDVDWLITSEILSFNGDGEIQLIFYKDQVICKSAVSKIKVSRSLTVTGDMPDPVVQWIENANRKLAEVDAQIVELEGMVDTATDAATRAEQSASTASTKAEQAAGSAATATEKATEATNAAGTATAKAAEAQTAAQTATEKATAAAESERIATAKAVEATTAAGKATAKAEQATEAAQTATEKAEEASASATAAHASATDAASSATAASASETAAKASETAASTSATQAGTSAQNAGIAAQTAMQKAAEATQSATDAAASATNAATSAETASTKAGEAAQSAQAVEQTAEQLAESLEQIDQNTQDIAELDERKANIDGYYPDMTVGNAEQLNSSKFVENSEPYTLRTSGGTSDIGNREYLDAVVGGTVAWNQMVRDEASTNETDFAPIVTVDDAVEDAAGVKVKLEPVQDLHGYDNPWPAGGGKNLIVPLDRSLTNNGVPCVCSASAETISLKGTATDSGGRTGKLTKDIVLPAGTYTLSITAVSGTRQATYIVNRTDSNDYISTASFSLEEETSVYVGANVLSGTVYDEVVHIQIEAGSEATDWTPYSNICPITGWDGVQVWDDPVHGGNIEWNQQLINGNFDNTSKWITSASTLTVSNNIATITKRENTGSGIGYIRPDSFMYVVGHKYFATIDYKGIAGKKLTLFSNSVLSGMEDVLLADSEWHTRTKIFDVSGVPSVPGIVWLSYDTTVDDNVAYFRNYNIFDLTQMFGEGNEPTTVEEFKALFPSDYYPYNAGEITTVSAVNGDPYRHYSITLPTEAGTVYGGELTVNADGSGSLVVDRASVTVPQRANTVAQLTNTTRFMISGLLYPNWYKIRADIISNMLVEKGYNTDVPSFSHGDNSANVYFKVPKSLGLTTSAEINAWLENNPIQLVYPLETAITYTLTVSEIRTLLGTNNVWSDTGDLALTYTGTDEHLTLESGKKYLARLSGTDSMLLGSGQEITAAKGTDNVFDLTQMFGAAVADYVYGQGAAFFRKWFPGTRYPYNAGELKHVEGLQSHDMVGFNQWDGEYESGYWDTTTGQKMPTTAGWTRSKNYIPVLPNTTYCFTATQPSSGSFGALICLDSEHKVLSTRPTVGGVFTTPNDAAYVVFYAMWQWFEKPICISFVHNGSRNGEYEPYEKRSYSLDSSVILRGIPKVGANGVYWDGDRYLPDGTVERRYGVVDLGTLNWSKSSTTSVRQAWSTTITGIKRMPDRNTPFNAISAMYTPVSYNASWTPGTMSSTAITTDEAIFCTAVDAYADAAAFKSAMSGVLFVYELATPTTETAQPYHSTQWVSDWGTEEFVSTGIVPVGSETRYPANLRDKLQHLPDAASGNGSYLITQTDGQMVLTPFPAPPSSAGNYVLKATVTGGVATYTWEVAT